ncbi:MAG TPA: hypothetical protein VLG25_00225 [Patescibacteria group bacterium]|nr:hypothetical protein [Patescibacteria group bacterium]
MTEVNRKYLIIPTPEELALAIGSMQDDIKRASRQGVRQEQFFDIRHSNANRLLESHPHVAEHLARISRNFTLLAVSEQLSPNESFLFGAKDLLEVLEVATTYTQLPDLET